MFVNERSYKLENEKISRLLLNLSLPATIGMIVNALYNVVDTIFIGRGVGTLGIGGLTIAFPIQMMIMALGQLVGIGAASIVSRALGAKDKGRADYVVGNAYSIVLLMGIITAVFGLSFLEPLLKLFGATNTILPYAKEYMFVIFIGSIYFPLVITSNNLVRAEGNAKAAMVSMLIGTGLNILLDPIFIFGFRMGIKGAALATILSQFASLIYVLRYFFGEKSIFHVKLYHLKIKKELQKEIFTVGFASFARQIAGSVVAIILNNSLKIYGGDLAISILGIVNRVLMFLFMPLFGVIQGMQPIVGFNYGAKKIDRVKETVKLSIIVTTVFASFSVLIGELFPTVIMGVFSKDINLVKEGAIVLRVVIMMVPIIGVQIVGSALFQALGKAIPSLILTLLRQVLLFIPLLLILPRFFGLMGIWITYPISDFISTIVTSMIVKREMEKIILEGR
ncbi:MATE family efflux transporter [Crassaminicella thermophila]|uniref:Multidrug export protein MepA n=1 Tax=Crassaminicella thermophila TaxID=2599308 RepID=A0A5C0SFN7_CRATE|nr:MATE family efflux transporter [Crassaminicella thermophila]